MKSRAILKAAMSGSPPPLSRTPPTKGQIMNTARGNALVVASLSAALFATGCQGALDSKPAEHVTTNHEALSERGPREKPRAKALMLVHVALRELDLTTQQRTAIEAALPVRPEGGAEADEGRPGFAALAQAVRAGRIDEAAMASEAEAKMREHEASSARALGTLHATLTKEQRRALVDLVEKRMAEQPFGPDRREHEGPPPGPRGEGRGRPFGPLAWLLDGIVTSDTQREAIHAALEAHRPPPPESGADKPDFEAMRVQKKAALEAFASDGFDANTTLAATHEGPMQRGRMAHFGRFPHDLAVVVPLLDPTQREALAQKIEAGPPIGPQHDRGETPQNR